MAERESGVVTWAVLALSVAVCAAGAVLLWLVMTNREPTGTSAPEPVEQRLEAQSFDEYRGAARAAVAPHTSAAPSGGAGRSVAEKYGVAVGDTRALPLEDGRAASLIVVGIRTDDRADGTGRAGLTLMASPIARRPMNEAATNAGGWEASSLRAWLAGEGLDLLPDALSEAVVAVTKRTNNVGVTSDAASVTETADRLWLFSASEVCGSPGWFVAEYGAEPNPHTGYVDFTVYDALLSAEGAQYEYFRVAGVSGSSDPKGVLELAYGGADTAWWYRTAYPYSFTGEDASYFYQVMASGYPSTTGLASDAAGVVVGMCL